MLLKIIKLRIKGIVSRVVSNDKEMFVKSLIALCLKVTSAFAAFILTIIITRNLGVEESGYYFISLTVVSLLSGLSLQGFGNLIVRYVAKYSIKNIKGISKVYAHSIIKIVPVSIIFTALVYLLSEWSAVYVFSAPNLADNLKIMSLAIIPLTLLMLHGFLFQGLKRITESMLSQSVALPVSIALTLVVFKPSTSIEVSTVYVIASLILAIFFTLKWNLVLREWHLPTSILSAEINHASRPFFIVMIVNLITQWFAQIMLGVLSGPAEVAIFATAQRVALLLGFISISINAIAAPKFAAIYKTNDIDALRHLSLVVTRILLIISVPLFLFILFSPNLIMGFFGEDFIQGSDILIILSIGQFVSLMTGLPGCLLQMTGRERLLKRSSIITLLFTIVFLPISIYFYSAIGGAIVSALSLSMHKLMCTYYVKKEFGFNTMCIIR